MVARRLPRGAEVTERWKCHDCGRKFTAWQTAQNHANEKGHVRVELILPEPS